MPTSLVRTSIPDVVEAIELSIAPGDAGVTKTKLQVAEGAPALAITVTDAGPDGYVRGPRDVHVTVRDPAGNDVSDTATRFQNGQLCILIEKPTAGNWTIEAEFGSAASAEIHASALGSGWMDKLRRGAHWFSCKTCKLALGTFVIAALLHLGPLIAAGGTAGGAVAILAAMKPTVVAILTQTLTLDGGGLPHIIEIILNYFGNPVDHILEQICSWLHLCS